jgi:hypothetical protein
MLATISDDTELLRGGAKSEYQTITDRGLWQHYIRTVTHRLRYSDSKHLRYKELSNIYQTDKK